MIKKIPLRTIPMIPKILAILSGLCVRVIIPKSILTINEIKIIEIIENSKNTDIV